MREFLLRTLGKNLTKWDRLRTATGLVSDEDLLNHLMHFYAETKGISLTEPQLPPILPKAGSKTFSVRVQPAKDETKQDTFNIVIHQRDSGSAADIVQSTGYSDPPAVAQQPDENSLPMLLLREEEGEEAEEPGEDDEEYEKDDPGEDDRDPEYIDIPIGRPKRKANRIFYREMVRPKFVKRVFVQDDHSRALDGLLWREAVFRRQVMPLADVRLVTSSDLPGPMSPTLLPWSDPPPVRENSSEQAPLREFGCALCDKMGFSSRVELVTHFWLQHPETRERSPTEYCNTKRERDFVHCSLCMFAGSLDPSSKHFKLEPHAEKAHVACQKASEKAPHVCDVCHEEFEQDVERDNHVVLTHPEHVPVKHTCVICGDVITGQQAYIRHLRVHYTGFTYSCNVCPNFRSRDAQTMAEHLDTHDRRTFRCGRCPFLTRTFRTLVDHLRIHLQIPRHVCPVCGYRAYTSSRYFNHLDSHGGRVHRCEVCSEEFSSMLKKSHHKIQVHRRPAKFTCDRCGVTFNSTSSLRRHQASHMGLKPYRCQLCGKGLASRQSLKNHGRICPENDELYGHDEAVVEMIAA